MTDQTLQLGEPADEADWRALVEQGLKGAPWSRLVGKTADGIPLQPLYREPDVHTAEDVSGMPGAAPFVRGARDGAWLVRQSYSHPSPEQTNREILTDLAGGVSAIELVIDPKGARGIAIRDETDFDLVLADVILEAAPVSLDAGPHALWAAETLRAKLKGVAPRGVAFNLDPIGPWLRDGFDAACDLAGSYDFVTATQRDLPNARYLRADARIVHEAGGTEAQELASALTLAIAHLRALETRGVSIADAAPAISFAVAVGPDVLIETAKLRALRLCWARILEASGAAPAQRSAHIHAFSSRRMMTRYDAWTNILRVTTSAFAAAIGGADDITTYPLTDALGLPTAFARRVARNTQHVLLEECRLGHVADPAGGAWFVETMTRDLAAKAWTLMQQIEATGGAVEAIKSGWLQREVASAWQARAKLIATRREAITGVSDYPLLDAALPETERASYQSPKAVPDEPIDPGVARLSPIRWTEPFERLRDVMETRKPRPTAFFANIGAQAEFGARAQWSRNLLAAGGVGSIGAEEAHTTMDALIDAFRLAKARVAVITGTDAAYAEHAENCAQRLKAAGADWVILAGKPGEREAAYRKAGVDQFVFAGQDAIEALQTVHAAFGVAR